MIRQTTICEENSYIYRKSIYKRETVSSRLRADKENQAEGTPQKQLPTPTTPMT